MSSETHRRIAATVKLIALDLDGTLINRDSSISERTRQYLQHLADSGRWISLVTVGHMKKRALDGAKRDPAFSRVSALPHL